MRSNSEAPHATASRAESPRSAPRPTRAARRRAPCALGSSLGLLAALGSGCAPEGPSTVCTSSPAQTWIVRELQFAREVEGPGRVAEGFDLDALNGQTCRIRDYTAPDGRGGIDNQLAALLPLIEMQDELALPEIIYQAGLL